MRLRLSIQRNRLPPTNILWNVTNTSPAYTVARLLEDINTIIPLEAEEWGLEDYVVEIGGFECLHFSEVGQALKDEDQVTIRPLATAEVRARTLGGRDQISNDGRHLVDGVPFGRPLLRTPSRPPIRIPPRKRQRMLENEEEEVKVEETTKPTLLLHAPTTIDVRGVTMAAEGSEARKRRGSDGAAELPRKKAKTSGKSVSFQALAEEELDSEDEDDDDDFAPDDEDDDEGEDEDEDDDAAPAKKRVDDDEEQSSESESKSSSDDETDRSSDSSSASESDSDSSSDSSSSDSDTDSDSDSDSDSSSVSDAASESATQKSTAPGAGTPQTKIRNKRRAQSKKLNYLKQAGVLPPDANLATYREWLKLPPQEREILEEKAKAATQEPKEDAASEDVEMAEASESTSTDAASKKRRAVDDTADDSKHNEQTALEQHRQRLLQQLEQGPESDDDEPPTQESSRKRLKPDIPATNRMLSPLARQFDKQAAKQSPKPKQPVFEESPAPVDPDFWKSRIKLSAYECWHEGYTLGPPPFPFQQHWDPASQAMRKKAQKNKKRNSQNRASTNGTDSSMVVMDNPDTNPEPKVNLDYGDSDTFNPDPSEAIESQLRQDVETAAANLSKDGTQNERDLLDLPPLPEDISTLPNLKPSDIKKGAIIAFKQFTLNPRNMNPELSAYKTAVVMNEGDSGNGAGLIGLELASRDVPRIEKKEKKYDRHGNRIFENPAEMFQMIAEGSDEDEDGEDGGMLVQFGELVEGKLVVGAKA